MVSKANEPNDTDAWSKAREPLKDSVRDSAQQIWQAGLGAFAKAQAEGTRAFEALVKEGSLIQRKTQIAAEEKMAEATSRMSSVASDISSKASGHWGKLEDIFENRVAKALNKLGVPSAKEVEELKARVDRLGKELQQKAARANATTGAKKAAPRPANEGSKSAARTASKSAASPASKSAGRTASQAAGKASAKRASERKP